MHCAQKMIIGQSTLFLVESLCLSAKTQNQNPFRCGANVNPRYVRQADSAACLLQPALQVRNRARTEGEQRGAHHTTKARPPDRARTFLRRDERSQLVSNPPLANPSMDRSHSHAAAAGAGGGEGTQRTL